MPEATEITLTPSEVAVQLKLSAATVYRLIRSGELPAVRLGGQYRVPARLLDERLRVRQIP